MPAIYGAAGIAHITSSHSGPSSSNALSRPRPNVSTASGVLGVSAPIHDFDCIYTHDIQRKRQKRWHDGFLRFHTFNKRVMVYDIPRNFIGDTHLKEAEGLQDGDELRLDRGVLVEVGERRGSMVQDVTPLFEKRRGPQSAESRNPAVGELVSALTSPESQRGKLSGACPGTRPAQHFAPARGLLEPKSLNALLGPRRGLQGRAALAKQAPFEQAHEARPPQAQSVNERTAKRPRLEQPHESSAAYVHTSPSARQQQDNASQVLSAQAESRITRNNSATQKDSLKQAKSTSRDTAKPETVGNAAVSMPQETTIIHGGDQSTHQGNNSMHQRLTSKLKATSAKRTKLMCVSTASYSPSVTSSHTASTERPPPRQRAPLRISTLEEQSASPPESNLMIMDFPTSQSPQAALSNASLASRKSLAELDRELLILPNAQLLSESVPDYEQMSPSIAAGCMLQPREEDSREAEVTKTSETDVPVQALSSKVPVQSNQSEPPLLNQSPARLMYPNHDSPSAILHTPKLMALDNPKGTEKPARAQSKATSSSEWNPEITLTSAAASTVNPAVISVPVSEPAQSILAPTLPDLPVIEAAPLVPAVVTDTAVSSTDPFLKLPSSLPKTPRKVVEQVPARSEPTTASLPQRGLEALAQPIPPAGAVEADTKLDLTPSVHANSKETPASHAIPKPHLSPPTDTDTGPWSRTAFDLFGFVAPPELFMASAENTKKLDALKKGCRAIRGSTRGMMREWYD